MRYNTNDNHVEQALLGLYDKYRNKYSGNSDSGQMCCMWSTHNPPDDIYDTEQILSIEKTFNIEFKESEVYELYDMTIQEAIVMIQLKANQC